MYFNFEIRMATRFWYISVIGARILLRKKSCWTTQVTQMKLERLQLMDEKEEQQLCFQGWGVKTQLWCLPLLMSPLEVHSLSKTLSKQWLTHSLGPSTCRDRERDKEGENLALLTSAVARSLLQSPKFTPKCFSMDYTENSILVAFHCCYAGG